MEDTIFCGQCGTENPKENNFCFKCGHKLVHTTDGLTLTETKSAKSFDYLDIKETLQRLIKTNGFSIISIGDFYVQFSNNLSEQQLHFEAVSNVFLPSVGNKDREFNQHSFTRDNDSNYYKFISHTDFSADQTVQEIKTIFETIYHINFVSYKIESDFEDAQVAQTVEPIATTNNQNQNKNYGCLAIIIIILVLGIYGAMSGDSEKTGSNNTEVVSNSAYDASVRKSKTFATRFAISTCLD